MEKKRELYSMFRFGTVLFAVLAIVCFIFGLTGIDGSSGEPMLSLVAVLFSFPFAICFGCAWGLRDQLKGVPGDAKN